MRKRAFPTAIAASCAMLALCANWSASAEGGGGGLENEPNALIRPDRLSPGRTRPTVQRPIVRRPSAAPARPAPPRAARTPTRAPERAARSTPRDSEVSTTARRGDGRPPAGETRFAPDEIVVLIAANATPASIATLERQQSLTRLGAEPVALLGASLHRYRLAPNRTPAAAITALRADRRVAFAQPNYTFTLQQAAAGAPPQFAINKLGLRAAHQQATGASVPVAVIDSTVDREHPELKAAVARTFDALDAPAPPHAHGTAIASVIGARDKLIGAAPRAIILAAAAFAPGASANEPALGSSWRILRSLDWASANGARVINLSFAGPQDPLLARAMAEAKKRGAVLIAAAGNAGPKSPPLYPAADPNALAVTALDINDKVYARASDGKHVTLAAPGVDIIAAAPRSAYDMATGTSIAAAHASGVAALLLEVKPQATPNDIIALLRRSARHIPASPPSLDAAAAIAEEVAAAALAD